LEESARLAAARLSSETARLAAKTAGLAEWAGLTAEGIGLAAGLISSAPWPNRWGGSSARDGAGRRREHELPQLIVVLIFVDLDAGTFVRTGDTGDRTDLIAGRRNVLRRGRLTRVGQQLVDEIQRRIRILSAAGLLPHRLSWYGPGRSLLRLPLRDRDQLAVRINPESWGNARLDSSRKSSGTGLSREGKLSRNLARYLAWCLAWRLARDLSRNLTLDLTRNLSGELWSNAATYSKPSSTLCSRLSSRRSQRDGRKASRLIRATDRCQRNRRKPARLSRLTG